MSIYVKELESCLFILRKDKQNHIGQEYMASS